MAGLRVVTGKLLLVKKIIGIWGKPDDPNVIPKRQLIVVSDDNAYTLTCTEDVLAKVREYETYQFVLDIDIVQKRFKIVGILEPFLRDDKDKK